MQNLSIEARQQPNRDHRRCGCQMRMLTTLTREYWRLIHDQSYHNHLPSSDVYAHPPHRRLTFPERAVITQGLLLA